jgi:hypothetical protein
MAGSMQMSSHKEKFWGVATKKCGTEKAVRELSGEAIGVSPGESENSYDAGLATQSALNAATQGEHQENQDDET